MRIFTSLLLSMLFLPLGYGAAQDVQVRATTSQERAQSIEHRHDMRANSIFREYPVRNDRTVVMSARVTDIAVYVDNPRHLRGLRLGRDL
ncbi:MAG: hypothetical protein U5K31_13845 [Balneolaceae bacterium]|nr:hypothetical protein [Balneolaceae bacterium]